MPGADLLLVRHTKIEESSNGYYFWLENSIDRHHVAKGVSYYNPIKQQLRIARWVLLRNAKEWGIKVDRYSVRIDEPEEDVTASENQDASNDRDSTQEVNKLLDDIERAVNALRTFLE
jgi:hypothetical protein